MRGRSIPGRAALAFAVLLGLLAKTGCDRHEAPPSLPAPPSTPPQALDPWRFHFVGGLVVITGEMEDAAEVTLKGTTYNEVRTLPFGPIRWELLRPPPGEKADLRTRDGRLLCHFDFDAPQPSAPEPMPVRAASPAPPATPPPPVHPAVAAAPPPSPPVSSHGAPRQAQAAPPPARPAPVQVPPSPNLGHPGGSAGASRGNLPPARPEAALAATPFPAPAPRTRLATAIPPAPPVPRPAQAAPPLGAGRQAPSGPSPVPAPSPAPALMPSPNPKLAPRTPRIQPVSALPAPGILPASPPPSAAPASRTQMLPVPPGPAPQVSSSLPATRPPLPGTTAGDWPGAGDGLNLLRGPKGGKRICMTFDGGSTAEVATDVLDALRSRGIRTTLFLTGEFIRKYPDLVRRMDREGHELGNHTFDHPHFAPSMRRDPKWTRERFQRELLDADRALYQLLGRPFDTYWRAPYGEHTSEIRKWAEELGYRHVGWSEGADTLDWATVHERRLYRTGNAILDRLRARMEKQDGDGLIVLMHLGSERPSGDRPAQVIGPFLDKAIADGWHFVTIGDYVRDLGKPKWDRARRAALLR